MNEQTLVQLLGQSPVLVFAWLVYHELSKMRLDLEKAHNRMLDLLDKSIERTNPHGLDQTTDR